MRVLYDGNIYLIQAAGGVNRYFANLIGRLPTEVIPYLTMCGPRSVNFPVNSRMKVYSYRRFRPAGVSYRLEKLFFDYTTNARRYDLAHPTYYTLLSRSEFRKYRCPVVVTVWDMIHELFPAELDPQGRHAEEKRRAIMAAQAVICISENTKNDLLERYSVAPDKVRVTHLASEIDASLAKGPQQVPRRRYFLYVGLRYGYKNFNGLLAAFARMLSARPGLALCVVGTPFSNTEKKLIAELGLVQAIEHYEQVSDAHLAKLYHHSVAFIYPSLYEGFGIPPLEAMACGTPVVASNRSSIPEVVGDAGLLFDPENMDELTDILITLTDDPSQRERLIARGQERAKAFSWDKTVSQTLEIYREVSGNSEHSRPS
jgi:glycosyltransferase involved in cell wall biosynthesis